MTFKILDQAFGDAVLILDELEESSYKDSTYLMQIMRDATKSWGEGDGSFTIDLHEAITNVSNV